MPCKDRKSHPPVEFYFSYIYLLAIVVSRSLVVWKIFCRSLAKKKKLPHTVLVYPSESVFALGGNPFSSAVFTAIKHYKKKSLSQRKGFILLVKDMKSLQKLASIKIEDYQHLRLLAKERNLTLVLKAKPNVPKNLCHNTKIAVRVVEDPWLQAFVSVFPFPLISTSLNRPKKITTKSIAKARVLSKRRNLSSFFVPYPSFTTDKTSRIYDLGEQRWLR